MKALILSAGQGSRLLPLTEDRPKCLLPVNSSRLIELQIRGLIDCGIDEIGVVVGFRAAAVAHFLEELDHGGAEIRTLFNPFYNVADNLASCWMARGEMNRDFVLLNGDTLFEPAVLERLLAAPAAPVTMAIDRKAAYDSDDMKVRLNGSRLVEVGKTLSSELVDGESIGMLRFLDDGPRRFAEVLDEIMHTPNGISWWYLKAIGVLADQGLVETRSIEGLTWGEVDFREDLERAEALFPDQPSVLGATAGSAG
jgi:choline kinase